MRRFGNSGGLLIVTVLGLALFIWKKSRVRRNRVFKLSRAAWDGSRGASDASATPAEQQRAYNDVIVNESELPQEQVPETQLEASNEELWRLYHEQKAQYEMSLGIARENRKTAELEYDKLIVALAGGGLTLTIGFVKDVVPLSKATHFSFLLATWIAFTLSLLTNLGSHRLTVLASDSFLVDSPRWRIYNRITTWANWIAMLLLVLGIGSFVTFVSINFPQMQEADKPRPAPIVEQPHPDDLSKGLTFPADTADRPLAPAVPIKPGAPKK